MTQTEIVPQLDRPPKPQVSTTGTSSGAVQGCDAGRPLKSRTTRQTASTSAGKVPLEYGLGIQFPFVERNRLNARVCSVSACSTGSRSILLAP